MARAPTKIARTPTCIRADLAVIGVLKYPAFLLSALVRDGGVMGGHPLLQQLLAWKWHGRSHRYEASKTFRQLRSI